MKLIDEKGRLFGKINLFDLLVVLLVVGGIAAISLRMFATSKQDVQTQKATYTLEIVGVQEFAWDAYKKGDQIYENGVLLGTLKADGEPQPYKTTELCADGTEKEVEHKLKKNVVLVLETDQLRSDGGYYIGTAEMLNGTGHVVSNGKIACNATVIDIEIEQ